MKKSMWLILSFLMALSLVLASCTTTVEEEEEEEGPPPTEEEEEEEEEEEGPPPVGGDWWDKFGEPEYGGTITYRLVSLSTDTDPWASFVGQYNYYGELLFQQDWTLDRKIWPFSTDFCPSEYWTGGLAESWEWTDPLTFTIHLHEGILWQNKPPVNGREFTAHDVQNHYDRIMGLGGYMPPSPFHSRRIAACEKVTATDDYTVVFKLKAPGAPFFYTLTVPSGQNAIEPPEQITMPGGFTDWRNATGTGAWILTDFVSGGSATLSKNTGYWGYDERHPENQLPYADTLKMLVIPDDTTARAAMRTGKIDILTEINSEESQALSGTNPELIQAGIPKPGVGPCMRVDKEPFTNVNIRKAMNMAIDRETIAAMHYGGVVEGQAAGLVSQLFEGYCFDYEDWPQALKDEYSYNPAQARQLLADAGYPDGFKTNIVISSNSDLDLAQIVKGYFMDIGVDMDIRVMESTAAGAFTGARLHDQMNWDETGNAGILVLIPYTLAMRTPGDRANWGEVNDPTFNALFDQFTVAGSMDEAKQVSREADRYALEQHWVVSICPSVHYMVWQPYFKGYSGEFTGMGRSGGVGWMWARCWIDNDLKKSMGH